MLGYDQLGFGNIKDLAAYLPGHIVIREPAPGDGAELKPVNDGLIRIVHALEGATAVAFLSA